MTFKYQRARFGDERGVTLVEVLVSSAVSLMVLGVSVQVAVGVQRGYTRQLASAAYEEEARFAIDWITWTLRSAGSNPFGIAESACPAANTAFQGLRLDPNLNGVGDDIRINTDGGLPNGLLGGSAGACVEADEDVTIAFNQANRTILRQDNNIDAAPVAMTDNVITGLQFTYLDMNRVATVDPAAVAYVGVTVNAQSTVRDPSTGLIDTITLNSEVRLRSQ